MVLQPASPVQNLGVLAVHRTGHRNCFWAGGKRGARRPQLFAENKFITNVSDRPFLIAVGVRVLDKATRADKTPATSMVVPQLAPPYQPPICCNTRPTGADPHGPGRPSTVLQPSEFFVRLSKNRPNGHARRHRKKARTQARVGQESSPRCCSSWRFPPSPRAGCWSKTPRPDN